MAGLAACLTVDPELFFPYSFQTDVIRQTKAVCATCPVTAERLNFAVLIGADAGILGGATAEERRSPATVNKVASPKPKRTSGADTEAAILSSLSAYPDMSTQQLAAAVSFEVATITDSDTRPDPASHAAAGTTPTGTPSAAQWTLRCPLPGSASAARQSLGVHPTTTRPGPHACPCSHWQGYGQSENPPPGSNHQVEHSDDSVPTPRQGLTSNLGGCR